MSNATSITGGACVKPSMIPALSPKSRAIIKNNCEKLGAERERLNEIVKKDCLIRVVKEWKHFMR